MGSVRQRGGDVWQARIYAGLDSVSGKRRYTAMTIHAKSQAAAERELRKLERKVLSSRIPRGTPAVGLGEQLDDWYAGVGGAVSLARTARRRRQRSL